MNFANYKATPLIIAIGVLWTLSSAALSLLWGYGWAQGLGPGAVVGGLLFSYDKWLWHLPFLSWLNTVPDIRGEYTGKITYFWDGEEQFKSLRMRIRQTCSYIKVTSTFGQENETQTRSKSTHAMFEMDTAGDVKLIFLYHNDGSRLSGDTLDCHNGTNILDILNEDKPLKLEGHYYTDRNPQTMGKMHLTRKEKV